MSEMDKACSSNERERPWEGKRERERERLRHGENVPAGDHQKQIHMKDSEFLLDKIWNKYKHVARKKY